jgi:hypothetical protein
MAQLSIGEALSDGFGLIGRRPLDCVAWGIAYFVFAILPSLLMMGWLMPDYVAFMRDAMAHPDAMNGGPFAQPAMALSMKMQALQPIIWLGLILGEAVVFSAIFRAVLRPQESGFFHLRLGATELWVGLVLLVQFICAGLAMAALAVLTVIFWIPTFIAGANHSMVGWEAPVGLIGGLAAAAVFFWLFVRFSMAAPMSFAERQFRLFESWRLTRGKGLSLFLLYLVIFLIALALTIVIEMIFVAVIFSLLGMNFGETDFQEFFRRPANQIITTAAPYIIGFYLLWAIIAGFLMAVTVGSWASAYRQLAPSPEQA